MKKTLFWTALIIVIIAIGILIILKPYYLDKLSYSPWVYKDLIYITAPLTSKKISSPLTVKGQARGNWYFEASFPVRLLDGNDTEIAVQPAQAQGEWMTTEYVPFEVVLNFVRPKTLIGTLILENDNPSGLPEHADEFRIPVRFR